jgi:hypothetical protein
MDFPAVFPGSARVLLCTILKTSTRLLCPSCCCHSVSPSVVSTVLEEFPLHSKKCSTSGGQTSSFVLLERGPASTSSPHSCRMGRMPVQFFYFQRLRPANVSWELGEACKWIPGAVGVRISCPTHYYH